MRFKTRHPDGDNYDGIVIHVTDEFVGLLREVDFEFDGFHFFPRSAIKGYRDNQFDTCTNRILNDNGQIKRLRVPQWLKTNGSLSSLMTTLKKRDVWPAVEVIFSDEKEPALYIGPLVGIADDYFSIRCYDAKGRWEDVTKIHFNEVFRLEFGSKYTKHFNNYMKHKGNLNK